MGAGYHGGFGNTLGRRLSENKASKILESDRTNYYSRNEILRMLDGITPESTMIVEAIKDGTFRLNILGDKLFDYYVTPDHNVAGRHENGKLYVRRSSADIVSSILHEGIHAMDYSQGIVYDSIKSELKAYRAEHAFQIASKRKIEFASDDEIIVHVYANYGRN